MFNNLQIRTCHTFVTPDRRPIKLYEIGRGEVNDRETLDGLPICKSRGRQALATL